MFGSGSCVDIWDCPGGVSLLRKKKSHMETEGTLTFQCISDDGKVPEWDWEAAVGMVEVEPGKA